MLQQAALVALGAAIGGVLRWGMSVAWPNEGFPWPTFAVNLVGSLLLGVLAAYMAKEMVNKDLALALGTGVLGAFTTMSTFSVETVQLFEKGANSTAITYLLLTFILCPLLAFVGWGVGNTISS